MKALALTSFTATSCIGRGVAATLAALRERRTGLERCAFETVTLDAFVGEVAGVDEAPLPPELREYECRNNRLAQLGLVQDGFAEAVRRSAGRHGRERVGVFLGTSTSGILETELAYRRRDPASGALPAEFRYRGAHNTFSLAAFARETLELAGPAVVISSACSSSAKVFASARRAIEAGLIDAALVGGVDSLCLTTLYGFHSLLCRAAPAGPSTSRATGSRSAKPRRSRSSSPPARASMGMRCCCSGWANRATPTTCPLRIRRAAAPAPPCSRPSRPPRSIRPTSST